LPERNSESRNLELVERLTEIGIALSSERNLDSLLHRIVLEGRKFTSADAGSLYLIEDGALVFKVAQNETLKRQAKPEGEFDFQLPLSRKSIAGYVALTGQPVNIEDVYVIPPEAEYRWYPEFDKQTGYKTVSTLAVPMRDHRGETIGVLQLINSQDLAGRIVPFQRQYEKLVTSLASQAAVAVTNVRLIEHIRELFSAFVRYSAAAIDARSHYTEGHTRRVAEISLRVARAINEETTGELADMNFSDEEIEELNYAAWLHDIGKIGVKEHVLDKAARLFMGPRIDVITNRFESIKKGIIADGAQRKIDKLQRGDPEPDLVSIDREINEQLSQVDDDLEFILTVNKANWISDEQRDRVNAVAKKTFTASDGTPRRYLQPDEVRHLTVGRGNLTVEEYNEVQTHVEQTLRIVEKIPFTSELRNVPLYAASHHEKLTGQGYPRGLKGDDIPVQARILAAADIFEALTAKDRPYKAPIPLEKALDILREEADAGHLDKRIVDLIIRRNLYEGIE